MFKPGSIRKIEVKNFVTYSYVFLYPGPNLNMILGPNATGKSTIVSAIILGLGGKPKYIGRGQRISEYIKHGCEEATITIRLTSKQVDEQIKITRTFDIDNRSTWCLNDERVALKNILEVINEFNIQIDNLCQFLPQDRVQDFAKLNKQELFHNTIVALCKDSLIEQKEKLLQICDKLQHMKDSLEFDTKKMQEAKDANGRLEGKIKNLDKKKEILKKIEDIDRKILWMKFLEMKDKLQETKNDMKKTAQILNDYKKIVEPLEDEISNIKKEIETLELNHNNLTSNLKTDFDRARKCLEKIEVLHTNIREIKQNAEVEIAMINQNVAENEATITKLGEMEKVYQDLVLKSTSDETNSKVRLGNENIMKLLNHTRELTNKKQITIEIKQQKNYELIATKREIEIMENVKEQKLRVLQRLDADCYNAVQWLHSNLHLFTGTIYDPMMLEINLIDIKNAIYLENTIPMHDRLAFLCTDKNDMNLLIRTLRDQKNLTINVVHSANSSENPLKPNIPIEQLECYGFKQYISTLFTAPTPIMHYLCKTYGLHNIPIGTEKTNELFDDTPDSIHKFFSDNNCFNVIVSRYSGEKSISQYEIYSDSTLSIQANVIQLNQLKTKQEKLLNEISCYDKEINDYTEQDARLQGAIKDLREKVKEIHTAKQQLEIVAKRIDIMKVKIEEAKQNLKTNDDIRRNMKSEIENVMDNFPQNHEELNNINKIIVDTNNEIKLKETKCNILRNRIIYKKEQSSDMFNKIETVEITLKKIKEKYIEMKNKAKIGLEKAKQLSNNLTPDDEGFSIYQPIYDELSVDLEKLQTDKDHLNLQIDCLIMAGDNELDEYNERLKQIELLENSIQTNRVELSNLQKSMEKKKNDWLLSINSLIDHINEKFTNSYKLMGCVGEVSLYHDMDDNDFSKYGIKIKVTYRDEEPLRELNSMVQSGGERAVATAIYLLSLQELTPVPFRCVDEINQGMDADNERKVFNLLVDSTSQPASPQYFLVTPKLVPNMKYLPTVTVHVIHNGPFVADKDWSKSKFCNPNNYDF